MNRTIKNILMILTTVIVIIGALTIGLSLFADNNQVEETIVDPKPMDEVSYEQYTIDLFMIGSVDNVNIDTLKPICHSFDISLYGSERFDSHIISDIGFNMVSIADGNKNDINKYADSGVMYPNNIGDNTDSYYINDIILSLLQFEDDHKDEMIEDIKYAVSISDVVIVCYHDRLDHDMAKILADNGADIIIGMDDDMAPIEWIDDTLVYYSLGEIEDDGVDMMASVKINKTISDGVANIEISQPRADLLYTDHDILYTFDELGEEYNDIYQKRVGVINQLDDSIVVGYIK